MRIRPPALGALIRNRRTKPALDQKSLAQNGGRQPSVDRGTCKGQAVR